MQLFKGNLLFIQALDELYQGNSKIVSMPFVEWWLLKYGDLYRSNRANYPPFSTRNDSDGGFAFCKAYYSLDDFAEYGKEEKIAETALTEYYLLADKQFSSTNLPLLNWLLKFEKTGVSKLLILDSIHSIRENNDGLGFEVPDVNFLISKEDLKYSLIFLELFQAYWDNYEVFVKLFPDSIAAIKERESENSVGEMVCGDEAPF